jgi:hypothetical protein
MLRALDHLWLRFTEARAAFRDPFYSHEHVKLGIKLGKEIAFAQVRQQLDTFDPYQFENQHFKMGYYYAQEQVKKVMPSDEDNVVD